MTPTPQTRGCTLHIKDGEPIRVTETKAEAQKKCATQAWQGFHTPEGNYCRVNCSCITKITND